MLRNKLARATGLMAGYVFTFWLIRLIFITLVAYTFVRAPQSSILQKIGDIVRANETLTYGLSAFLFVAALHILQPLTRTGLKQVFDASEFRRTFAPNALNGLILAAVLIVGSMLGGHMSYLGVYLKFDEVAVAIGSSAVFGTCILLGVIIEEYLLRTALEPEVSKRYGVVAMSVASSAVFLAIKYVQFDLGLAEAVNFTLFNLVRSGIARAERSSMASATFSATFLIVVHIVFGLPFMGQDLPGIFLLRASGDEGLGRLLSGGSQGPEAGLVLTVLLIISLYLPQIRSKKIEV